MDGHDFSVFSDVNDVPAFYLCLQLSIFETKHLIERGQFCDLKAKLFDLLSVVRTFSSLFLKLIVFHIPLHATRPTLAQADVFGSFWIMVVN